MTDAQYDALLLSVRQSPLWVQIALTLYGEARGEPYRGKVAVAEVMKRRNSDGQLWNDILAPYQFSCWNRNDPNLPLIQKADIKDKTFQTCVEVAHAVIAGTVQDSSNGATHYYAFNSMSKPPYWAADMDVVAQIENHRFLKERVHA